MEKDSLNILILEDREEDAFLIERVLKKAGVKSQCFRVDTRSDFVHGLNSFNVDIVLSDHALPQFDSMEALKVVKKDYSYLPFILVTGTVSEEFAAESIKEGADDYVLKSNLSRLPGTIMSAIEKRRTALEKIKAEEALKSQNEELIKLNKELDSFVYSISHDLRAPLKSVLGLLNLCDLAYADHENLDEYLKRMRSSINRLDHTLKEILDYSRNERLEVVIEKIDLKSLINDSLEGLRYLEGSSRLEVEITINNPNQEDFYSDKARVIVIINNILSNAIKYLDSDKNNCRLIIQITIGPVVNLIIQDNGIGIEKEQLANIFNMFYRATEKSDGAGLGLYIVKEAIEKLGGEITVHSKEGIMTEFIIQLPNQN